MPRALLHIHRATNLGAALPFAHALRHTGQWELALMVTPFDREANVGLPESYVARLRKLGAPIVQSPHEHQPDVTFTFEPVEAELDGAGMLVRIPSGISGRGSRFSEGRTAMLDNLADLLLVPGIWHEDRISQAGKVFTPVKAVGLTSLDPLTGNWLPPREVFCQQLQIAPDRKVILYTPSHEPERSSLPILWTRVGKLADDGDLLIVRPHPYSDPQAIRALEELAERHPNVMLSREIDIQAYLRLASVVVTDTATTGFEAAAIGTPVVLFDNPNQREDSQYSVNDPEYAFRNLFPCAKDLAGLRREVRRVIDDPSVVAPLINAVRTRLIMINEQTATQRILEATLQALSEKKTVQAEARLTILMNAHDASPAAIESSLETTLQEGGIASRAILLAENDRHLQLSQLTKRWADRVTITAPEDFQRDSITTPFALHLLPGVRLGKKGSLRLVNHLRRLSDLDGIVPLVPAGSPAQDPRILLNLPLDPTIDLMTVDRDLAVTQAGVAAKAFTELRTDVIIFRTGTTIGEEVTRHLLRGSGTLTPERLGVAADVIASHPEWINEPIWERRTPLTHREISEAERRIQELSTWIGRIMPHRETAPPQPTVDSSSPASSGQASGRLRLALHYEQRGNVEQALDHLRAYQQNNPNDPEAIALKKRLSTKRQSASLPNREA